MLHLASRIFAISLAVTCVALEAAVSQEPALVIKKDGISPELRLGEVVEATVSSDGVSVVIGGKSYPRGYVALKPDGCFEVGVQQGLDSGIFKEARVAGRDMNAGPAMEFAFEVSADVKAGVEICPDVDEPFVVEPVEEDDEDSPPEKSPPSPSDPGPPQRMVVVSVWDAIPAGAGETTTGVFEAYCLDQIRRPPGTNDRFKVKLGPEVSLSSNLVEYLGNLDSQAEEHTIFDEDSRSSVVQHCVWASFIADHRYSYSMVVDQYLLLQARLAFLERVADEIREHGAEVTLELGPGLDLTKFGAELRSRIAMQQLALEVSCPFTIETIRTQWSEGELSSIIDCLRDGGTRWACAAPVLQPALPATQ